MPITKTIRSLTRPSVMIIMAVCFIVTAALLVSFIASVKWAFGSIELVSIGFIDTAIDYLGGIGATIIAWFLFPLLTPIIASLFCDITAKKIEQKDYAGKLQPIKQSITANLISAILFTLKSLFLNILCLPFYFIPLLNIFIYYLLNSYLLGREFFEIAANRYIEPSAVNSLRRKNRFAVMSAGLMITFATNLPMINLVAPIIAIVLMMHLFARLFLKNSPQ
jgi:CysZ protein